MSSPRATRSPSRLRGHGRGLLAVGPGALVAAGDDGPTRSAPPDRLARTILRPTEITDAAPARFSDKTVIVLVSTFCVLPSLLVVFLGPPLLSLVR